MFLSVRLALRRGRISYPGELDMRLPYLVACLLSACAGPQRSLWAVAAAASVLVWLLWSNRPRRARRSQAIAALLLCVVVAGVVAGTVSTVRRAVGPIIMDIMRERLAHWRDPFRSYTALGEIGQLKLSDRIVLRIESPPGIPVPALLHEASYTHLSNNVWLAGGADFEALKPQGDGTRWDLSADRRPFRTVTVSKSLIRNKGMLALPAGAFRIDDLPVEELTASPLGALKVLNGPALVRYQVRYAQGSASVSAPTDGDLAIPARVRPVLERTLDRIVPRSTDGAVALGAASVVRALSELFSTHFSYSLALTRPRLIEHPVETFLEGSRSGHCEFFATATVLLLRAAGIPARYATGYSVQEYSALEQAWLVRRRHSHSWASAWLDGRWIDVDTTPSQWVDAEADGAASWQPIYDVVSWLWHRFSRWRLERSGDSGDDAPLLWLLAPLAAFLAWRVYRSRRVGRERKRLVGGNLPPVPTQGLDSAFYRVEAMLAERGLQRPCECTPRAWLARLARDGRLPPGGEDWSEIVALHYRLRFGPGAADTAARSTLERAVRVWLERAGASRPV